MAILSGLHLVVNPDSQAREKKITSLKLCRGIHYVIGSGATYRTCMHMGFTA